jgi:uncharacterized repeat protein (TIGR01451 family)
VGNLFIADSNNQRIRKVNSSGIISTVAGNGNYGFNGDGGAATAAQFRTPRGLAVDGAGNLFIADSENYRIRKVNSSGIISTVAGNGNYGFSGDGGLATSAQFAYPVDVASDGAGNLFIADGDNLRIRKVSPSGIISTVAGNGSYGFSGDGGAATSARISYASGVAVDGAGNLFIADHNNDRIRKVSLSGIISTVAGNGDVDGGLATSARLHLPTGMAVDGAGNLYFADTYHHRVRKITPTGIIQTVAGNGSPDFSGDGGPATSASLNYPDGVAVDSAGNLFIADGCNSRIRKVTPGGIISSVGDTTWGFCDYYDIYYGFVPTVGMALDAAGNLLVADFYSHRIRKVTPSGVITTVAGNGTYGSGGDGGQATSAQLAYPTGVAMDAAGNLHIADTYNHRIRKVIPSGIISTVAGNGTSGFSGDNGPATSARLSNPWSVGFDTAGVLFIADRGNNRVRRVTADGIIATVAGNGSYGFSGDGGAATSATFAGIGSVVLNATGVLFIADSENNRIRRVGGPIPPAVLTSISPGLLSQGVTLDVTFTGAYFTIPLTIDVGSGVTVGNVRVLSTTSALATFTIASDAALGERSVSVTTSSGPSNPVTFNIVPPFPDLFVTVSHTGNLGVGFNGTYAITVVNTGSASTSGPITLTDILADGLTFVSGTGTGWSCSTAGKTVTCVNSESLAVAATTSLSLVVAVSPGAASQLVHKVSVESAGDLISSNNTSSDVTTIVATPSPALQVSPLLVQAGQQAAIGIAIPVPFPFDVSGSLTLTFAPNAVVGGDDPGIVFATGSRQVSFVVPANTLQARFGTSTNAGAIAFQPGTVAGTLSFNAVLNAGTEQKTFQTVVLIPRAAPVIKRVQTNAENGFAALVTLLSTPREVTHLTLEFITAQGIRLSCGSVRGCVASDSSLTFDVRDLFGDWYAKDTTFGSLTTLRIPLSFKGNISGSVLVRLRDNYGVSNAMSFVLP